MKKGYKLDHRKLAERHLRHLSEDELEMMRGRISILIVDRKVLRYADAKMLQSFNKTIKLPKPKKGFVTFKRFEKL